MELFKKILKWVGISLSIIAGLFILLIILMSIFPGMRIFGLEYVGGKNFNSDVTAYVASVNQDYRIYVNTQNFNIDVVENLESNEIQFSYVDSKSGFASVADAHMILNKDGNTFDIHMTEPQGVMWGSGSIKIALPTHSLYGIDADKTFLYNITLQTVGGDITINHRFLDSISINMNNGEFNWKANEKVNVYSDGTVIPTDQPAPTSADPENPITLVETKTQEVKNIKVGSFIFFGEKAKINMDSFDSITIDNADDNIALDNTTHSDMIISNDTIDMDFNTLIGSINLTCNKINIDINNLLDYDRLKIFAHSGSIKIGKINYNKEDGIANLLSNSATIITNSANINISETNAITNISTTSGDVSISQSNAYLAVETTGGSINIGNAIENINLTTNTGNITIDEYYMGADITTKTGNIVAHNKGEHNSTSNTKIKQDSGNITIISENNEISITSRNGSNISATFRKMCMDSHITHSIINTSGSTNIYVLVADLPFKVRATGNVTGELGSNVVMTSNTQEVTYNPANVVLDQYATLSVEGGKVHFVGIYE